MAHITKFKKLARRRLIYHLWVASEDQPPIREIREEAPDADQSDFGDVDGDEDWACDGSRKDHAGESTAGDFGRGAG